MWDVRQTGMFSYRAGICNRVIPNVEDLNPIASASDPLEGQRRRMRYQTVPASQPNATEATTASIAPPRMNANPVACCPAIGLIAATIDLKTSKQRTSPIATATVFKYDKRPSFVFLCALCG